MDMQFTNRYKATGTPYPDKDSCNECEGMGVYPLHKDKLNRDACNSPNGKLMIIGQKEENGKPLEDDNYVFVICPYCEGKRKKANDK